MDCVALAAKLVANRPDTVTPKQGDLPQPLSLFYAQALEHRCKMMRDMAMLIEANGSPCPIHQRQIIGKIAGERLWLTFSRKRQQQGGLCG